MDDLLCTVQCVSKSFPSVVVKESTVGYLVSILEEMNRSGSELSLPSDEERLHIFFNHINHFCCNPIVTVTSIKFLTTTNISNKVLVEVLDQLFCEEKQTSPQFDQSFTEAFDLVFKFLSLFSDGNMLKKVLKFWKGSVDQSFQTLSCLITLFVEQTSSEGVCLQESAEKTLNFLDSLDGLLIHSISSWYRFLAWFIKEFSTSFCNERRPEVLFFIRRAVILQQVPDEERPTYDKLNHALEQFLEWVSQQSCTEEMKKEIILLFTSCADDESFVHNVEFLIDAIKRLSPSQQLQFSTKKSVMQDIIRLAKLLNEREREVFQEVVEEVTLNQTLELKDDIFSEILHLVKRCPDVKTTPADILQLLSLVSRSSLSGERRVKLLQTAKKSGKDFLFSFHILQLIECHHDVLKKEANIYFDVLFSTLEDILKEDKDVCRQFHDEERPAIVLSAQFQDVWRLKVSTLISLGVLQDEIDSQWCLPVLKQARKLSSPLEMLELYSQVRASAVKVVELLRHRGKMHSSPVVSNCFQIPDCVVSQTFVLSLGIVVRSNVLSDQEKLLLVKKVCNIFLRCPDSLSEQSMENALSNLIPFSCLQNSSSSNNKDVVRLELNQIEDMLENHVIMAQLSRIPVCNNTSLCTVLSTMNSDSFGTNNIADIYHFIGSQGDLDQAFFDNFLSILEKAIRKSNSVEDVLEILRELVCVLRSVPSEFFSFVILNFEYLLENEANKHVRLRFLDEVVMKWDFSPNAYVLSYLEIPRLLWEVYTTADTPAKRYKLIDRLQEILKKTNEKVGIYCVTGLNGLEPRDGIIRKIGCCELECLVLHSPWLSNDEAALACNLIFRSYDQRLRCLTFSDVKIEEGCLKFASRESESETSNRDNMSTTASAAVKSVGNPSPAIWPHVTIITPVLIAQKVIHHFNRILGREEDPNEKAFLLWDLVFCPGPFCCDEQCAESMFFLDDYLDVFLSILAEVSSTDVLFHWINQDRHHVLQCLEVVLKACKGSCIAGDISKEAMLKFQATVSTTMEKTRMKTPQNTPLMKHPCFRLLKPQIKNLGSILEYRLPIEVKTAVLHLFQINFQAGHAVVEIVSSWSCKQQAMNLIEGLQLRCKEEQEEISPLNPTHSEFVWQLLKAFGRFCMNSCKDILGRFEELIEIHDPDVDVYGFNRLPKWRQMMIADGFPANVIDCWCVAFLTTPLKDLSLRDVVAIVDLNSCSLLLVASLSQRIKRCIFPEDGFQVSQGEGIKEQITKERLRLAKLLGEFIKILKLRKPEENCKDAVIKEIVVDACNDLCKAHENKNRRNDLYKIHEQYLKALFTEVFGKQCKPDDGVDCADVTTQTVDEKPIGKLSRVRQPSYFHENLPRTLGHNEVYEPLLVLVRRSVSRVVDKPTLASHTLEIVQLLFSAHSSELSSNRLEELHTIIQARILSLEENQALIAQLQASGYNQKRQKLRDLWSSSTVEYSGCISKRESPDRRRYVKKLTQVLRSLWTEWKDILFMLKIPSIKVGETDVCTRDLFGLQASLEEMEDQVFAVKKTVDQTESKNLERRVKQLIGLEKRHRARTEKLYKGTKNSGACGNEKGEVQTFVVVWENRFLENVKLCSERIPGCYSPTGSYSEKPLVCALSVDNKFLTIFKEEKNGRREEIENVEVKLMEPGMYVYGLYASRHDYVTDELWAAFFKMLLDESLVPSISLSNKSPGFDWIKEYVKPVTSLPYPWKWELHQGIVPLEEDHFEHLPIKAALFPALCGLTEFVTLTKENVASFQFKDLKDACAVKEQEKRTKEIAGKAIQELTNELCLLHGDDEQIRTALVGKLSFAVKETIKSIIDGEHPTEETVKKLIDMKKLSYKNPKVQRTEERRKQYATAVLRACKNAHCDKC